MLLTLENSKEELGIENLSLIGTTLSSAYNTICQRNRREVPEHSKLGT